MISEINHRSIFHGAALILVWRLLDLQVVVSSSNDVLWQLSYSYTDLIYGVHAWSMNITKFDQSTQGCVLP